ncbi:MAG TPA: hypothetical protein VMM55_11255 [Thermohalobaculum sp.]|nr:hypothetical protein [Thermohalobaculum sp.]
MRETPSLPLILGLALILLAGSVLAWARIEGFDPNPFRAGWDALPLSADDAVRIVQVRDLAEGQGWFDHRQTRLGAGEATEMHWSRLVDAPLLALRALAETAVPGDQAERAMAAVWPRILALPWLVLSLGIAGRLAGRPGVWAASLLLLPAALLTSEFFPGRVDHHNVQLVLVLAVAAALIGARERPWLALAAGLAAAASLAIGLETLPVLAAAGAAVALAWALGDAGSVARRFGLGLAGGVPIAMATLPPRVVWTPLCDQLSLATAVPLVLAGLGLAGLTLALDGAGRPARLAAVAGLLVAAVAAGLPLAAGCLAGPYADLPPDLLREMDALVERRTLAAAFAHDPADSLYRLVLWPLTGLAGLAAASLAPSGRRFVPGLLLVMGAFATATAWVELRGVRLALPLATFGGVWLLARIATERGPGRAALAVAAPALLIAVTPLGPLLTPGMADPDGPGPAGGHNPAEVRACTADAETAPLAALPPGRVLAAVNLGSVLLLKTPHHVIAAPYHRAPRGLAAGFRLPRARAADVRAMAAELAADYLVVCDGYWGGGPGPGSLYADLAAGRRPDWLTPLPGAARLKAYAIRPAPDP